MKEVICSITGVAGGIIASLLGGWDSALMTLMGVDYITGLIVAGVFRKSRKSTTGALESRAGWSGLLKKGVTLLIVLVACRLDVMCNLSFIRDTTITAFIVNETISITENAGLMGIPLPGVIKRAIDILSGKGDGLDE